MTTFIVHGAYGFVDNIDGKNVIVKILYVLRWRYNITTLELFMSEDLTGHKDSMVVMGCLRCGHGKKRSLHGTLMYLIIGPESDHWLCLSVTD